MNKITKYLTTGAAAMLLLMSVGVIPTNVNAAHHYRTHVTRNVKSHKYNIRRNRHQRHTRHSREEQVQNKNRKANAHKFSRRNKKAINNTKRHYRKSMRKYNTRRNRRAMKHYARRINRHYNRRVNNIVLKSHYRIANSKNNRRNNRSLIKAGFYDGKLLSEMPGSAFTRSDFVFCKYAPNDKRAVIPSYMNPKDYNYAKKFHVSGYRNINNDFWIKTNFSLSDPQKATKNPKVYKYNYRLHGWQLAKHF